MRITDNSRTHWWKAVTAKKKNGGYSLIRTMDALICLTQVRYYVRKLEAERQLADVNKMRNASQ